MEKIKNLKKRILITGGNSRFAKNLKKTLYGENIIYTTREQLDILSIESIEKCFNEYKPDYVIHLAALSRPMILHEQKISSSIDINIIGTANVVKKCSERNIKLIYFSSNHVYPGTSGNYSEEDPVLPINNYAWSKLGGEASVRLYKNSLILRLAMTEYPFIHESAYEDATTNFLYSKDVAKIIPFIIDECGILNIGSEKTESIFSFAKNSNPKVKASVMGSSKSYPKHSSVNIEKLRKIIKKT